MHAHWLPGLDDGAETMEDSLNLIRELVGMGYRKLIATPHVMADLYPNTSATIRQRLEEVRTAVNAAGIQVELDAAAEYLMDEGFEQRLQKNDILTLPGNHVLVEFSFVAPPPTRDALFFQLLSKGYVPVLAHPERYRFYHRQFEEYRNLAARGIKLQVNLLSLLGYYGNSIREVAEQLIAENLVDILGTDAHHERHLESLQELSQSRKFGASIPRRTWKNTTWFA